MDQPPQFFSDFSVAEHYIHSDTLSAEEIIQFDREAEEILATFESGDLAQIPAGESWEGFYSRHSNKFFQPKRYLCLEFPSLRLASRILDIGCGTGSSLLPILMDAVAAGRGGEVSAVGLDASHTAVAAASAAAVSLECPVSVEFRAVDVALSDWGLGDDEGTFDAALLIFSLSAMPPQFHQVVLQRAVAALKPGGSIYFRDYARGDMTQLRLPKASLCPDGAHVRGDRTVAFFFTEDYVRSLFASLDLEIISLEGLVRVLLNKKTGQKMNRRWIHLEAKKRDAS
jgi:SAM-dependent methyltransferase